jgi:hypothetical protein
VNSELILWRKKKNWRYGAPLTPCSDGSRSCAVVDQPKRLQWVHHEGMSFVDTMRHLCTKISKVSEYAENAMADGFVVLTVLVKAGSWMQ